MTNHELRLQCECNIENDRDIEKIFLKNISQKYAL